MAGLAYQCLDRPSLFATMDAFEVKDKKQLLIDIRSIERGALEVMNDRK